MPIYLVRHGETQWNRERRFQSFTDVPLNDTGVRQAQRIAVVLRSRVNRFNAAYSSPLSRAVDTARIILDAEPVIKPALVEMSLGDFEGCRETDLRERIGEDYDRWREKRFTEAAPGGEDINDVGRRLGQLVSEIASQSQHGDVLVVAHQNVNMVIKSVLSGRQDPESLGQYVQANDEVDVYDGTGMLIERFRAPADSTTSP